MNVYEAVIALIIAKNKKSLIITGAFCRQAYEKKNQCNEEVNHLTTDIPLIWKPVNSFALVSI